MRDADKTKKQLVTELAEMRRRITDMQERRRLFEASEVARQDVESQLQHRVREMTLLNRVTMLVAATKDMAEALRNVCAELARFLQVPQAGFALLNPERTAARVIADYRPPGSPSAIGVTIPVDDNPSMTYILEHKSPLAITEAQSDPLLSPMHDVMRQLSVQSILLVPILVEGEVIGTLGLDTFQRRVFSQADIELVQRVASPAGLLLMWKQTEESLRESEERFRNYFKLGLIGMVVTSPEREWIEINDSLCEALGYSRAELVGKTWDELTHPEDVAPNMALLDRVLAGEMDGFSMEKRFIRKNGEIMMASISTRCLRRPDGSIDYFVTLAQDITERKRAEDLIRAQHDLALKLGAAVGLDQTLRLCVAAAIQNAGMDVGGVYLVDEVTGDLSLAFSHGLSDDFVRAASHYDAGSPSARLVRAGKPVYVNYLVSDAPLDGVGRREGLRLVAALPVHHRGQVIACLNVASHSLDEIPATARDTLETIAAQIGSFVARARAESQRDATLETLRDSEEKYRTLFESSSESIILVGLDSTILDCNYATTKISGLPREAIIGRTFMELGVLSEEDVPKYTDLFSWAINKGETNSLELKLTRGSNETRWIEVFPTILRKDGDAYAIQVIASDITERVQAEQALRESEARFRNLSEAAEEGIAIHDHGVIVEANEALARIFGYELSEMIGMHAKDLATPESWQTVQKRIAAGYDKPYEGIGVRKGGSTFHCELVGKPYQYRGKTLRVVTFRDITERVRAEQMLRRRNRELTTLYKAAAAISSDLSLDIVLQTVAEQMTQAFDSSGCALSLWNREQNLLETLVDYSAAWPGETESPGTFHDLNDYPATRQVLKTRQPMVIQFDDQAADEAELALMAKQEMQTLLMLPLIARDQVLGLVELTEETKVRDFTPEEIRLAQSLAAQAAVAIENARMFTQEEQHTAELARALEQQHELERLRSEFVRNVSHELRTPLAVARGHAELLETGVLGELRPEQRASVTIIARRMRALSEMMGDFAAIIDAEMELHSQPVDLGELMHESLADSQARATAEQTGLTLTVEIAPGLSLAYGDPIQLRRVVDNLLNNALKFTPAGGHVAVRLGQQGENLVLEVADTGIGIPGDKLERIFERFYQIDGSTTRRYGGTGLGLALVKEIVRIHGGQVSVQSTVGQGSTFTVTLPACPVDLSH